MQKKLIILIMYLLLLGCGVVRDNPVDKNGDDYERPSLNITASNIESDNICYDSLLSLVFEGNSEHNLFQYSLDGELVGDWSLNGDFEVGAGKVGPHLLRIRTMYEKGIDVDSVLLKYFVLPKTSIFLTPQWIDTTDGEVVYLSTHNLSDTITSMHIEIGNAKIKNIELVDSSNSNLNVLYDSISIDIANLPGSDPITGTLNLLSITLGEFMDSSLVMSAILRDKNNNNVVVDSVIGALYED